MTVLLSLLYLSAVQAVTFPNNQCAVVVASRQNMDEVRAYVDEQQLNTEAVTVYPSSNGWLAISVGLVADKQVLVDWKKQGKIPADSFCSNGEKFSLGIPLVTQSKTITKKSFKTQESLTPIFSDQQCALIVAARKTLDEVELFMAENNLPASKITVYPTRNGWYAISVGLINVTDEKSTLLKLKQAAKIPSDSYCTTSKYLQPAVSINRELKNISAEKSAVVTVPVPPKYAFQGHFSDGLALIQQQGLWGFVSQADEVVIPPQYEAAKAFYQGVAIVKQADKFALIDTNGQRLTDFDYTYLQRLTDNTYLAEKNHQVGLIKRDASIVLPIEYDTVESYQDGIIFAVLKGKRYRLKQSERYQRNADYDYIGSFREGLAVVAKNNQWGYINTQGNAVIKPQFEFAAAFYEGRARVKDAGLYGYVNHKGSFVIAAQYTYGSDFSGGKAQVEQAGKFLSIDKNGLLISH